MSKVSETSDSVDSCMTYLIALFGFAICPRRGCRMTLSASLATPWTDFAGIVSSSPQKKMCLEYLRYSFRTVKKILSNKNE